MESPADFLRASLKRYRETCDDTSRSCHFLSGLLSKASCPDADWAASPAIVERWSTALTAWLRALFTCQPDDDVQKRKVKILLASITLHLHARATEEEAEQQRIADDSSIYWCAVITAALTYTPVEVLAEWLLATAKSRGSADMLGSSAFAAQYVRICHGAARRLREVDAQLAHKLRDGRDGCVQRLSKALTGGAPASGHTTCVQRTLHPVLVSVRDFLVLMRTLLSVYANICSAMHFVPNVQDGDVSFAFGAVHDQEITELFYCDFFKKTSDAASSASATRATSTEAAEEAEAGDDDDDGFDGVAAAVLRSPYATLAALADRVLCYVCYGQDVHAVGDGAAAPRRLSATAEERCAVQAEVVALLLAAATTPYDRGTNMRAALEAAAQSAVANVEDEVGTAPDPRVCVRVVPPDIKDREARFERLSSLAERSCATLVESDELLQCVSADRIAQEMLRAFARRSQAADRHCLHCSDHIHAVSEDVSAPCSGCLLRHWMPELTPAEVQSVVLEDYAQTAVHLRLVLDYAIRKLSRQLLSTSAHLDAIAALGQRAGSVAEAEREMHAYLARTAMLAPVRRSCEDFARTMLQHLRTRGPACADKVEYVNLPSGHRCLVLSGSGFALSSVKGRVEAALAAPSPPSYIFIIAEGRLVVDTGLTAPGVSVCLKADSMYICPSPETQAAAAAGPVIVLDTSGRAGQHGASGTDGLSGAQRCDGSLDGLDGTDGESGEPGENAGDVLVQCRTALTYATPQCRLRIIANGGRGGDGGSAGSGGNGATADDAEDQPIGGIEAVASLCSGLMSTAFTFAMRGTYAAQMPGRGGNTGQPGAAGLPGRAGRVTIHPPDRTRQSDVVASNARAAASGALGVPGEPGGGGCDGMALAGTATRSGFIYQTFTYTPTRFYGTKDFNASAIVGKSGNEPKDCQKCYWSSSPPLTSKYVAWSKKLDKSTEFVNNGTHYYRKGLCGSRLSSTTGTREVEAQLPPFDEICAADATLAKAMEEAVGVRSAMQERIQAATAAALHDSGSGTTEEDAEALNRNLADVEEFLRGDLRDVLLALQRPDSLTRLLAERAAGTDEATTMMNFRRPFGEGGAGDEIEGAGEGDDTTGTTELLRLFARLGSASGASFELVTLPDTSFLAEHRQAVELYHGALHSVQAKKGSVLVCLQRLGVLLLSTAASPRSFVAALSAQLARAVEGSLLPQLVALSPALLLPRAEELHREPLLGELGDSAVWRVRAFQHARAAVEERAAAVPGEDGGSVAARLALAAARAAVEEVLVCPLYDVDAAVQASGALPLSPLFKPRAELSALQFCAAFEKLSAALFGRCAVPAAEDEVMGWLDLLCDEYVELWRQLPAVIDVEDDDGEVMTSAQLTDIFVFLRACVDTVATQARSASMQALFDVPCQVAELLLVPNTGVASFAGRRRQLLVLHRWLPLLEAHAAACHHDALRTPNLLRLLVNASQFRGLAGSRGEEETTLTAIRNVLQCTHARDDDTAVAASFGSSGAFAAHFRGVATAYDRCWRACQELRAKNENFQALLREAEMSTVEDSGADLAEAVYQICLCKRVYAAVALQLDTQLSAARVRAAKLKKKDEDESAVILPYCFCQYEEESKEERFLPSLQRRLRVASEDKLFVGTLPCMECERRCRKGSRSVPVEEVRMGNEIAFSRFWAAFLPRWVETLTWFPERALGNSAKQFFNLLTASFDPVSNSVTFRKFYDFPSAEAALRDATHWLDHHRPTNSGASRGLASAFCMPVSAPRASFPPEPETSVQDDGNDGRCFSTAAPPHAASVLLRQPLSDALTRDRLRTVATEVGSDALHARLARWQPYRLEERRMRSERLRRWEAEAVLRQLCRAAYTAEEVAECKLMDAASRLCRRGLLPAIALVIDKMQGEKRSTVDCEGGAFVVYPQLLHDIFLLLTTLPLTLNVTLFFYLQSVPMLEWLRTLPHLAFAVSMRLWAPQHYKQFGELCWSVGLEAGEKDLPDFLTFMRSLRPTDFDGEHLRTLLVAPPGICLPTEKIHAGVTAPPPQWSALVTARRRALADRRSAVAAAASVRGGVAPDVAARMELDWAGVEEHLRLHGTVLPVEVLRFARTLYEATHAVLRSFVGYAGEEARRRFAQFAREHLRNAYVNGRSGQRTSTAEVEAREAALWRDDLPKVKEVLLTILLAFYQDRYKPYKVQVLAVVALLFQGSSCLANISTGEGKTYIGGCVVAFKAYLGYTAVMLSSNDALAKEAAQEHRAPLELLFGGTPQPPCRFLDPATPQKRTAMYAHKILYGTLTTVIGDHLHALLHPGDYPEVVQWERNPRWVLADEADVPMVSSFSDAVYIGDARVDFAKELLGFPALLQSAFFGDDSALAMSRYHSAVQRACLSGADRCLSESRFQLLRQSAATAITARNNAEFVSAEETTMPYDMSTGSTMWGSIWRNGVSALINLKEGRRFIPERHSTVAMASLTFFHSLKGKLTAITGTAGNHLTRLVYKREYGLSTCVIPPAFPSQMLELLPVVTFSKKAFEQRVVASVTRALGEKQSVLLVQNTIGEVTEMHKLMQSSFPGVRTGCYSLEEDARPQLTGSEQAIFCATQRGGRGMDIRINTPHGLHVILCSPQDERNTYQAERRAARRYDCGTSQRIFLLGTVHDPFVLSSVEALPTSAATNASGHYYFSDDGGAGDAKERSDDQVARLNAFYALQNLATARERSRLLALIHHDAPLTRFRDEMQREMWGRHRSCARLAADATTSRMLVCLLVHRYVAWLAAEESGVAATCDRRHTQLACLARLRAVFDSVVAADDGRCEGSLTVQTVSSMARDAEEQLHLALAMHYDVEAMAPLFPAAAANNEDGAEKETKKSDSVSSSAASAVACAFGTVPLCTALVEARRSPFQKKRSNSSATDNAATTEQSARGRASLDVMRLNLGAFQDRLAVWVSAHRELLSSLEKVHRLLGTHSASEPQGCVKQIADMIFFEETLWAHVSTLIGERGRVRFGVLSRLYNLEKPMSAFECLHAAEVLLEKKILFVGAATYASANTHEAAVRLFDVLQLSPEQCASAEQLEERVAAAVAKKPSPQTLTLWAVLCDATSSLEEALACMERAVAMGCVGALEIPPALFHLHNEDYHAQVKQRLRGTHLEGVAENISTALTRIAGALRCDQVSLVKVAAVETAVEGLKDATLVAPFRTYGYHQTLTVDEHAHCATKRGELAEAERKRNSKLWTAWGAIKWIGKGLGTALVGTALEMACAYVPVLGVCRHVLVPLVWQCVSAAYEYATTGTVNMMTHMKSFAKRVAFNYVAAATKCVGGWIGKTQAFGNVRATWASWLGRSAATTAAKAAEAEGTNVAKSFLQNCVDCFKSEVAMSFVEQVSTEAIEFMVTNSQDRLYAALEEVADMLNAEVLLIIRAIKSAATLNEYRYIRTELLRTLTEKGLLVEMKKGGNFALTTFAATLAREAGRDAAGAKRTAAMCYVTTLASSLVVNADATALLCGSSSPMREKMATVVDELWSWAEDKYKVQRVRSGAAPSSGATTGMHPDEAAILNEVRRALLVECLGSMSTVYGHVSNVWCGVMRTAAAAFKQSREEMREKKRQVELIKEKDRLVAEAHLASLMAKASAAPSSASFLREWRSGKFLFSAEASPPINLFGGTPWDSTSVLSFNTPAAPGSAFAQLWNTYLADDVLNRALRSYATSGKQSGAIAPGLHTDLSTLLSNTAATYDAPLASSLDLSFNKIAEVRLGSRLEKADSVVQWLQQANGGISGKRKKTTDLFPHSSDGLLKWPSSSSSSSNNALWADKALLPLLTSTPTPLTNLETAAFKFKQDTLAASGWHTGATGGLGDLRADLEKSLRATGTYQQQVEVLKVFDWLDHHHHHPHAPAAPTEPAPPRAVKAESTALGAVPRAGTEKIVKKEPVVHQRLPPLTRTVVKEAAEPSAARKGLIIKKRGAPKKKESESEEQEK